MRYSREQVADKLAVSVVTLFRWVKDGRFPPASERAGRRHYWPGRVVEREVRRLNGQRRAALRAQLAALDGEVLT